MRSTLIPPASTRGVLRLLGILWMSGLILAACGGPRVVPLSGTQPAYPYRTQEPRSEKWRQADSLWELRADPESARKCLKAFRAAAKKQKSVPELQARLSHVCNFVAAYMETSLEKKDALFREGQAAAEKGMLLHPGYAAKFKETGDETAAARELDSGYVELLYWYTVNLGRELNQESVIIRRGNKERIETLNQRVMEMDPGFYYAGPHRLAGAIPARLPEGNLQESRIHFEKAIEQAPEYLGNRVAYADFYAVRMGDKQLFQAQLTLVAAANPDSRADIAPENRFAQAQAKLLLSKSGTLFK
jgi:hypothetical protein